MQAEYPYEQVGKGTSPRTAAISTLADQVRAIAARFPERDALVVPTSRLGAARVHYERFTYREISERADALASGLSKHRVTAGSRVAFMLPPGIDAVVTGVALASIGATLLGVEPRVYGLRQTTEHLRKVAPDVFIGIPSAHLARVAFGWGRDTLQTNIVTGELGFPGALRLLSLSRPSRDATPLARRVVGEGDIAAILFTTGSTGTAKPAVVTYRGIAAMLEAIGSTWGLSVDHPVIDMPAFPIFWLVALWHGGTVVVPPMRFTSAGPLRADPAKVLATIDHCHVTSMFGSPALLEKLARHARRTNTRMTSLSRVVAGGAEVSGKLVDDLKQVLPPEAEVYVDYGATEALPISELAGASILGETWPQTLAGRGVCVGRPLPTLEVCVIAVDDGPIDTWSDTLRLPTGHVGELVVRGPHVSGSYFRDPGNVRANKIRATDGAPWHRVGDLAYLDHDGRIWLAGRLAHRVVLGGGKTLYPLFCEPIFNAHPAVRRSALVGVTRGGETTPVICIEPMRALGPGETACTRSELLAIAREHEPTRSIQRFEFFESFPVDKRHNAKIERPTLRTLVERRSAGRPSPRR